MLSVHIYATVCVTIILTITLAQCTHCIGQMMNFLRSGLYLFSFSSYWERGQEAILASFPRYPEIRFPLGIILLLANALVIVTIPGSSSIKITVMNRLGPLIVTNMIPLFLLGMRHSPLACLLLMSQPELLWAHAMMGVLVTLKIVILCVLQASDVASPEGEWRLCLTWVTLLTEKQRSSTIGR